MRWVAKVLLLSCIAEGGMDHILASNNDYSTLLKTLFALGWGRANY